MDHQWLGINVTNSTTNILSIYLSKEKERIYLISNYSFNLTDVVVKQITELSLVSLTVNLPFAVMRYYT